MNVYGFIFLIIILIFIMYKKILIEKFKGSKCLKITGNTKGSTIGKFKFKSKKCGNSKGSRKCGKSKGSSKGSKQTNNIDNGTSKGSNNISQNEFSEQKYGCDMGEPVILLKKAINVIEPLAKNDPVKKYELDALKQALDQYLIDCSICNSADNDLNCLKESANKLLRQLPFIKNSVYPWINYDWNYGNYVDNNYSAKATGSSPKGTKYIKNMFIFLKLLDGYITAANPDSKSKPCAQNKHSDYAIYGCQGDSKLGCDATQTVKTNTKQLPPYDDDFFEKKLDGENSSSYFARAGMCPITWIDNSKDCLKKNYEWVVNPINAALDKVFGESSSSGACYKPRYMYLNNTPGLELSLDTDNTMLPNNDALNKVPTIDMGKIKGYIPSVANDLLSITPDKLYNVYNKKDVKGHMILQKCPKNKEEDEQDDESDDESDDDVEQNCVNGVWSEIPSAIDTVLKNWSNLKYAPDYIKNTKSVILAAVQKNGNALQYASNKLKCDKDVVITAVKNKGQSLKYACSALKCDTDVTNAAVSNDGMALYYCCDNIKNNKDSVLKAVQQNGMAIWYASDTLKRNTDILTNSI